MECPSPASGALGSSHVSPATGVAPFRTFVHLDRLKRKLSLVAPVERGDSSLASRAAAEPRCAADDVFAFEPDARADAFGAAESLGLSQPTDDGEYDEFAFDAHDLDCAARVPARRPAAERVRDAPRGAAWLCAGGALNARASPASSSFRSGALSSPVPLAASADASDIGDDARRAPRACGALAAGASPASGAAQSTPASSPRVGGEGWGARTAQPSLFGSTACSPSKPHRAREHAERARAPASPSSPHAVRPLRTLAACDAPAPARAPSAGARAPPHSAPPAALAAAAVDEASERERAYPPATHQLLAVLAHCVTAAISHADEAEVSSDSEDEGRAGGDEAKNGARHRRCGSAERPARAGKCALADVHDDARRAILTGAPGAVPSAVALLLEQGADVDAIDADRNSPLYLACHLAAPADALAVSRMLVRRRAHPNPRRRGLTPLNYALRRGHAALARLLLEAGAYPLRWIDERAASAPPAPAAARPRAAAAASAPAAPCGRPSCPQLSVFARAHGFWPEALCAMLCRLDAAVDEGSVPIVEGLLMHGCPPNERDAHGRTPLFRAVSAQQRLPLVLALLGGGAHAETRDACGTHVLAAPIIRNDAQTVRALLKYRADPLADEAGVRIDQFALQNSTSPAVQALLARCAAHALGSRAHGEGAREHAGSQRRAPSGALGAAPARAQRCHGSGVNGVVNSTSQSASPSPSPPRVGASIGVASSLAARRPAPPPPLPPLPAVDDDPSVFDFD
ncbi:hypothetical protein KFE25_000160 [Diacronema lutheri]|uniref:Uncharacterized protein n=1 Tax=Diacronema lutheri TaxID=2081491 RepID=A0A8J5XHC3_DIALT|nr:hypothetical protein KFE25_000160 [Diacronema lutheri]